MATKTKTFPADTHCAMCSRPIAECTVGGLHGAIRERAALAVAQRRVAAAK